MASSSLTSAPDQTQLPLQSQLPPAPALCNTGASSQLSPEAKGQLLDIVGIQSTIQIFNAKYPTSNVVCGMQVGDAPGLQWQCFGPDAGRPEVRRVLKEFVNEEVRHQHSLAQLPGCSGSSSGAARSHGAHYHALCAFVDAAANAGVVAGVQVSMLVKLASELCSAGMDSTCPSQGTATASAPALIDLVSKPLHTDLSCFADQQPPAAATAPADTKLDLLLLGSASAAAAAPQPPLPLQQPLQPVPVHATAASAPALLRLLQQSMQQQQQQQQQHEQAPHSNPLPPSITPAAAAHEPGTCANGAPADAAQQGCGGSATRGGRKPRFTKEQHAAIMESVERNYAQHPSRYTELVIREMRERFPGLELASASIRKLKFRASEASKGDSCTDGGARDSAVAREAAAAAAAREAVKSLVGLRNSSQQQQQEEETAVEGYEDADMEQEPERQQQQQHEQPQQRELAKQGAAGTATMQLATASGLLQCLAAAKQLDAAATAAAATAIPSTAAAVGFKRARSEALEPSPSGPTTAGGRAGPLPQQQQQQQQLIGSCGGGSSKRQRMTPEQMASLVECVKRHVESCPERYTQLVIADMKAAYPDLELNMGQIRKIKFRTLGNSQRSRAGDELEAPGASSECDDDAKAAGSTANGTDAAAASGFQGRDRGSTGAFPGHGAPGAAAAAAARAVNGRTGFGGPGNAGQGFGTTGMPFGQGLAGALALNGGGAGTFSS